VSDKKKSEFLGTQNINSNNIKKGKKLSFCNIKQEQKGVGPTPF
jgi:hypothetical protein